MNLIYFMYFILFVLFFVGECKEGGERGGRDKGKGTRLILFIYFFIVHRKEKE